MKKQIKTAHNRQTIKKVLKKMLQKYFEQISDPRQEHKVKHNLLEIVIMTICAVIAECEAWYQIEHYCKSKEIWFRKHLKLKLKNGMPSHDTFERVFAMIDPNEFKECFLEWVNAVKTRINDETISIDGKTVRGSRDSDKNAIH